MDKNTKDKLTQKWWKDNKAKTLRDKGNLDKALKDYEGACKVMTVTRGQERATRIKAAEKTCDGLHTALSEKTSVTGIH